MSCPIKTPAALSFLFSDYAIEMSIGPVPLKKLADEVRVFGNAFVFEQNKVTFHASKTPKIKSNESDVFIHWFLTKPYAQHHVAGGSVYFDEVNPKHLKTIDAMNVTIRALRQENETIQGDNSKLRRRLDSSTNEIGGLNEHIRIIDNELGRVRADAQREHQNGHDLRRDNEGMHYQIQQMSVANAKQQGLIRDLTAADDRLKLGNQTLVARNATLEDQNTALRAGPPRGEVSTVFQLMSKVPELGLGTGKLIGDGILAVMGAAMGSSKKRKTDD